MSGWNAHQQNIVDACLADYAWLIRHQVVERYQSERPYEQPTRKQVIGQGHRFEGDCTGTIKLVACGWHGIPVFDGQANGYGDTRSFFYGPKVYHVPFATRRWQPLDIVLYKAHSGQFRGGPREHATILTHIESGHWHCFSMGSTPGPDDCRWDYRGDAVAVVRFRIPVK